MGSWLMELKELPHLTREAQKQKQLNFLLWVRLAIVHWRPNWGRIENRETIWRKLHPGGFQASKRRQRRTTKISPLRTKKIVPLKSSKCEWMGKGRKKYLTARNIHWTDWSRDLYGIPHWKSSQASALAFRRRCFSAFLEGRMLIGGDFISRDLSGACFIQISEGNGPLKWMREGRS